jgi:hypothetical protein
MKLKRGSALVLVLLITTILSFLAASLWYKSSLLVDLVLQEEQYYKNFYLVESFLEHGVLVAKESYSYFFSSKQVCSPIIISINLDEKVDKSLNNLTADVCIKRLKLKDKFENKLYVVAMLKDTSSLRQIFRLSCKLCKYEFRDESGGKRAEFFLENFTIGNFI